MPSLHTFLSQKINSNNNTNTSININTVNKLAAFSDKGIDEHITNLSDCKYYTVSEFYYLKNDDHNLNIFHNNVNGLETKFENLHHFLSKDSSKFDIIVITETSQKINHDEFYHKIRRI